MEKDSFILFSEQKAIFDKLSDEQAGKLIKAIFQYTSTGVLPELDQLLDIAIISFITSIDRNNEKWEQKRNKRSEAGKKGMAKRWEKEQEEITNDNNVIDVITNDNIVINDITNDNKNNNVINDITNITDSVRVSVPVSDNKKEKYKKEKVDEIFSIYEEEHKDLPKIKTKTPERRKRVSKFLDTFSVDDFRELISKANKMPFLLGQNDRGWKADFDWLVNVNNSVKVLEEKYSTVRSCDTDPVILR